ncbi:MAG: hypothetical protein HY034_03235 [Nitrospirae bacterium]|nr:hypothetical protein [Nitrospirota bacterium]
MLNFINKRNILFLSLLLIIKILLPSISFADADKIFKENNKAVVVVVAFDEKNKPISQGSGFIVPACRQTGDRTAQLLQTTML